MIGICSCDGMAKACSSKALLSSANAGNRSLPPGTAGSFYARGRIVVRNSSLNVTGSSANTSGGRLLGRRLCLRQGSCHSVGLERMASEGWQSCS